MTPFAQQKADALRFITGFELKHGRGPSIAELADAQFAGSEYAAQCVVGSLVVEGKLRRALRSRERKLQALVAVPVPRAPDGEPLHFVRIGEAAA